MIDFATIITDLEAELGARELQRTVCSAEILRLTQVSKDCADAERLLYGAIDAVRALDQLQRQGAAAPSPVTVSMERAGEILTGLDAGAEARPSPLPSPARGEGEEVAAAPEAIEEGPHPDPLPGGEGEGAAVAPDALAPCYSEPSPVIAAAAEPEPALPVAAPVAAAVDAPAGEMPIGEGRKLANRIAAAFPTLMQEFPEGPTIRQLTDWFDAPDIRVRDACRILATAKTAALQKRKSTGYLHLLPIGARP